MSHFSLLVITPTKPTQMELETILAPWHEFECTGLDDQYVKDIDITAEARAEFKAHNSSPDNTKMTFVEFLSYYYGDDINENGKYYRFTRKSNGHINRVIHRTNPNKKWDWWVVGGRWGGHIAMDKSTKGAINIVKIRDDAEASARIKWKKFHTIRDGRVLPTYNYILLENDYNHDKARQIFSSSPVIMDLNASEEFRWDRNYESYSVTEDEYASNARAAAFTTFAVVKDGTWFERGEMGWFGSVSNEMSKTEWYNWYADLINKTPSDQWFTVVDCHI